MSKKYLLLLLIAFAPWLMGGGQTLPGLNVGPLLPDVCVVGASQILTTGVPAIYFCSSPNTWTSVNAAGVGLPSGAIGIIIDGACPGGYSEVPELNGKTLVGTLVANSDIGQTGGNNLLTPTGTIPAPVFVGAPHAHELPIQFPSTTGIRQIAAATFGTGTSRTSTGNMTGAGNVTSTPVLLSESVTATGIISAPVFTGNPTDNRSAFVKVIFCKRN